MNHNELIKKQFSKQAPRFEEKGLTLTNREYLKWIVDNLALQTHFEVLDVAAGSGHLSRAMAPYVKRVVALDLTPEMLLVGRREAEKDGITNILFEQGLAEALPYSEDSYDMVVSRFSVHHFKDPKVSVKEMARVCRPNERVAIIDLVSPEDEILAATYNRLERLRDPSHTLALSARELQEVVGNAGLDIVHTASREVEVNVNRWLDLTSTVPEGRRRILEELTQELEGLGRTGMRPFIGGDELMFIQTWIIVVGEKPSLSSNRSTAR